MRQRRWMRQAVLWGVAMTVVLAPTAAMASCAVPPPKSEQIEQADVVFVGTVEAIANDAYWATVRVEEIWKGPDLVPVVQVRGSDAEGPDQARTSVDRRFEDDTRYLFVLRGDGPPFRDDICGGTEVWNEDFAQYRPADWREPTSPDPEHPDETGSDDGAAAQDRADGGEGSGPDSGEDTGGEAGGDDAAVPEDGVLASARRTGNGEDYDGRLLLAAGAGLIGLLALGWWVQKES